MATTLNMTLLLRRAEFADSCVLQAGEPGYHTITKELKIGDGSTTWSNLPIANKTQIEAIISNALAAHAAGYYTKAEIDAIKEALEEKDAELLNKINENTGAITAEATARTEADNDLQDQIDTKLAAQDFNSWKDTHEADHAKTATEITNEITTAVNDEKSARELADTAINNKIGSATDNKDTATVYGAIAKAAADAAADASAKADAAQAAAESTASAALTTVRQALEKADTDNLAEAKSYADTQREAAKTHAEGIVATEKSQRESADTALGNRLTTVEGKLANVSNVMDFVGAAEVLPAEGSNHNGDVIVITTGDNAGKEFVYDESREVGKKWVEFGSTSASDSAIASLKDRMDAAEGDIDQAQSDLIALGTGKLDKSIYETYINGKSMSDEELKSYADGKASAAQSAAETEAGRLDGILKADLQKEIDTDVEAAIAAEVTRSNAYADKAEEDAVSEAVAQAEAKDVARATAAATDATNKANAAEAAAKKYADDKDLALKTELQSYADTAETDAIEAAEAYTNEREVEIKKYVDQAETDAVDSAKSYTDSQDAATLTAAKAYTDEKVADAVTKVSAGIDIVVTPAAGTGSVTVAHKTYGTGTYTKPDSISDANFVTGITIENGHVTGASVKSLAEALASMTFIFDGGTSAT